MKATAQRARSYSGAAFGGRDAAFEELGRERRAASRDSRRARHLPATKPAKLTAERQQQLRRLAETGEPVHELAKAFGISRATAYRYLSTPIRPQPESLR